MHFKVGEREFEILKRLPSGEIQIMDIVTNVCSAKPEEEIIYALFGQEVELLGKNRNQVVLENLLKKTKVSDLTVLKDDDPRRPAMERRRAYVIEAIARDLNKLTEETLLPVIDKISKARGDIERSVYDEFTEEEKAKFKDRVKPSVSALIRWINLYVKCGEDERAFVPATKSRGNGKRKFSGPRKSEGETEALSKAEREIRKELAQRRANKVGEIVDEAIDEVLLNKQRFSVVDVHELVVVKVADDNEFRAPDDQLPTPELSSIYDVVDKLDDEELLRARYGDKIADEKYKAFGRGPRPTMPLERVEADHTKLDLFVVDPVMMLPMGRPILTWLVCVFTKMILGFYISFNPYGSLAIMECLKHAIRPKNYVREKYPSIRNIWQPYGVMKKLVLDNAPEFWGRHLEDACRQLGINIQYGKKGHAYYRPTVERSFRTFNDGLVHRQPGTTFSNILDRADYDPTKNAIITPDTLDEATHKFIIDYLQYRPHRGIHDIPALRWDKGVRQWPPSLPAKASDLDIVLGYMERRTIQHYGIEIDTLIYNDEDLTMLRSQGKKDDKYIVKRNPNDLSLIYVYDEKHDRYIPVPAVDQEYMEKLTLWQHRVIRRYVREQLKLNVDIISLCRAKAEIREIVERDWNKANKSRAKMARWRNEGIQDRRERIESWTDEDWVKQAMNLTGVKERPRLMSPEDAEASRKGVSDLESALDANDSAADGESNKSAQSFTGSVEDNLGTKTPKSKKGGQSSKGAKQSGAENHVSGKSDKKDMPDSGAEEDNADGEDDLDMTGWSANYDTPR
jgi:putative transposase